MDTPVTETITTEVADLVAAIERYSESAKAFSEAEVAAYELGVTADVDHAVFLTALHTAMENGHKAHWGIVTGVAIPTPHQPTSESVQLFHNHFKFSAANQVISAATKCSSSKVKVIMRQSKSLELEFYNRDKLLQSCDNLNQVASKRLDGSYIVPKEGIATSLKNKIILMK